MKKLIAIVLLFLMLTGTALADRYTITSNVNLRDVSTREILVVIPEGTTVTSYKETETQLYVSYSKKVKRKTQTFYGTIYKQYAQKVEDGSSSTSSSSSRNSIQVGSFDMTAPYNFYFYASASKNAAKVYLPKGISVHVMAWTNHWIYARIYGHNGFIYY